MLRRLFPCRRATRPGVLLLLVITFNLITTVAHATPAAKSRLPRAGRQEFVKDQAMARILGETLFKDTVEAMSAPSPPATTTGADPVSLDKVTDNSAVGQVARNLLARQTLDKYLWLIQRAYDDSMWKGGDRARIEQHFGLIWRTSILLYEASVDSTPTTPVRVCTPNDVREGVDCHNELERVKVIPIPLPISVLALQDQSNSA